MVVSMLKAIIVILSFVLSYILTGIIRRYALVRNLIDIPNERSSHSMPTPRGGGLSIVIVFLLFLPFLAWAEWVSWNNVFSLIGSGFLVAVIGFLDDHGHIAARWRLLGHFIAAGWVLYWLGSLPPLYFMGHNYSLEWFGFLLAAIYMVWLLNLYNFMDGIDGLASLEAVSVCLGAAVFLCLSSNDEFWVLPIILAAASFGFLLWNFPPAKIFMGDAGSGFLGFILAVMSIQMTWINPLLFWSWIILLGVFIVDATFTLIRRILRGEKIYEAHRSHSYQCASRKYKSHKVVTVFIFLVNIFWLLPIAVLVSLGFLEGVLGVIISYTPILFLCYKYSSGLSKEND